MQEEEVGYAVLGKGLTAVENMKLRGPTLGNLVTIPLGC